MIARERSVDVLVVGAGPAGLTAAAGLAARGCDVLVLERESEAGGIPRHSDHPGYGIRDLHRVLGGPAYARLLVRRATAAGAQLHTASTVTGWSAPDTVEVTAPTGRHLVTARAVVLATGARERPRPARLIPGDRPAGVLTTGQLQNLVHLHRAPVGTRAVVVGAELVSWSAVLTLRQAGVRTVLMTSAHQRAESFAAFDLAGRMALRVPVATRTRVIRVVGAGRVSAVEVEHIDTGQRRLIPCDTVVFTGDWIPDHELARTARLTIDPGSAAPLVDAGFRTSTDGVFAIGNLVHPVDTADVAALDGRSAVGSVLAHLAGRPRPRNTVRILVQPPLRWISPGWLDVGGAAPARNRYLLWTQEYQPRPRVVLLQDGRVLAARTLLWPASPGRVFRIPSGLFAGADPTAGDITVTIQR